MTATALLPLERPVPTWALYEPPGGRPTAIAVGPIFVRCRAGSRWHRVRSGHRWPAGSPFGPRTTWSLWCGPYTSSDRAIVRSSLAELDAPVCGTCEGRACGAGQIPDPTGRPLIFSPSTQRIPAVCPGSRRERLYRDDPTRPGRSAAVCLACGWAGRALAGGSPYGYGTAGSFGMQRHAPADLVPPCDRHGWLHLTPTPDGLSARCACEVTP